MKRRLVLAAALALTLSGCFPKRHDHRPPRADIAAVSDLHLGDPRSMLHDSSGRAVLVGEIATACHERGVRTLVLDGDVLEMAMASETSTFDSARDLFRDLNRVRGLERVVVIIGNHDHRLFEEIPDPMPEKIGREYREGTRFHREVSAVVDRLEVIVVYPGWTVPLKNGSSVHFTHGHYFDRLITPSFEGALSVQEVEERNQEWWSFLNAGGRDPTVRAIWRGAYHFGHHVAQYMDTWTANPHDEGPVEMSKREQERVAHYVEQHIQDPTITALVAGHTHKAAGRVQNVITPEGRRIGVWDPGAFVVGHHGRRSKPHIFYLDTKSGEMRLERLEVPDDVFEATRERAFETNP